MIELKNINIVKPIKIKGKLILKRNAITIICGNNGAGKTILFYQIALLDKLQCDYYIDGRKIKNNDYALSKERAKHIGIVLQNNCFINNISLYSLLFIFCKIFSIDKREILNYFKKFNLFLSKNIKWSQLSTGQKEKISIIMALVKSPLLIILDEPTASLDKTSTEILKEILVSIKKDKIICIITHDQRLLSIADEIYNVTNERIELLND